MDVKFPLSNYEKYIEANDDNIKEIIKNDFLKDIKNHIKTITNRTYINPTRRNCRLCFDVYTYMNLFIHL